jgi:hypothetical protein
VLTTTSPISPLRGCARWTYQHARPAAGSAPPRGQPRRLKPADRQPHRRRGCPHPSRNLADRHAGRIQSDPIAHMARRKPLRWHPGPPSQSRKARPYRSQKRPRHPGRHHPGMVGDIERNQHGAPLIKNVYIAAANVGLSWDITTKFSIAVSIWVGLSALLSMFLAKFSCIYRISKEIAILLRRGLDPTRLRQWSQS